MKKPLQIIGLSLLALILFRGPIFRFLIHYSDIGTRTEIQITNIHLIEKIESKAGSRKLDLEEIAKIATGITGEELQFTMDHVSSNPNELIHANRANCVGYSAMFNSIANYLIRTNKLESEMEATHKIGKLSFWEFDLHQLFNSAFFRDHDFNELKNKKTGKVIFVDPSVNDYLMVTRITKGK